MNTQKWWKDPIAEEIHSHLREKEMTLPPFLAQSPQIGYRRYLVDWLATVWEKYTLCQPARHLTVALLDFFMDRLDIESKQLHLVAIGCLLIACKFEEIDVKIPRASDLNNLIAPPGYTNLEYLQVELTILDFFKWKIGILTPAHFTEYYMMYGLSEADMHHDSIVSSDYIEKTWTYLKKYVNYFLEVCLQDHYYRDFKPSLVGAACIAAARTCLNIEPVWSTNLQSATQYFILELNRPLQALLKTHGMDEQNNKQVYQPITPPHTNSNPNSCQTTPDSTSSPTHPTTCPMSPDMIGRFNELATPEDSPDSSAPQNRIKRGVASSAVQNYFENLGGRLQ